MPKNSAKFDRGHQLQWRRMQVGWVKIGDFRQITGYISKTVHVFNGTWFLLKSNRKSYALYRMVTLPMTLSAPSHPKPPHFTAFCTAIPSFATGESTDFKFGTLIYHSKSHPADEKSSLKGAWSVRRTVIEFYTPCNFSATANAGDFKFRTQFVHAKS